MEFKSLFNSQLMKLNHSSQNQEELFEEVARELVSLEYVNESYQEALVQREQSFPTGLKTNYCNIAIPHTDAEHVRKPFIYLVQLQDEVEFHNMGDSSEEISVKLVLFLGITDPKNQTILLSTLMEHFQTEEFSKTMFEEIDTKQLEKKLNIFFTGGK
ncbi:PTS sugar transporter subunit IIA [Oceanobacillus jeddahense]|uniref:PTS sugar transporter subunit IIA n=1 Tax=Oceanobacillus jeddahense TaxID=1462527 RepID=A0ABY5JU59_9BACI|nr:PTS sugar transporter subunit IIA [Oceanobacillus jeddahense]UUI03012.1 PTS sugar transporter subunit IIA [Oceanobacillus jeddahense]